MSERRLQLRVSKSLSSSISNMRTKHLKREPSYRTPVSGMTSEVNRFRLTNFPTLYTYTQIKYYWTRALSYNSTSLLLIARPNDTPCYRPMTSSIDIFNDKRYRSLKF